MLIPVVVSIFFYPAAGSAVCTKEACAFRDALAGDEAYKATGLEVVGISADSVEKQKKFVDDNKLSVSLFRCSYEYDTGA